MNPTRIRRALMSLVLLVAAAAAVLSFVALYWIGLSLGWPPVLAWLLPVCVDGFAVACSIGVVRSQSAGEPASARRSEWGGLLYALGLSVAGNVAHAAHYLYGTPLAPPLAIVFTAAPPLNLVWILHLYGRTVWAVHATQPAQEPVHAPEPAVVHEDATAAVHATQPEPQPEPVRAQPEDEPVHGPLRAVEPLPQAPDREVVRARFAADYRRGTVWTAGQVGDRCGVSRPQGSRIRTAWVAELTEPEAEQEVEQEAVSAHG